MTTYWTEYAWLPSGLAADVRIDVDGDGRVSAVEADTPVAGIRLPGVVLPGLANAHSHAFHRALRGRTHGERGSFWTWRDQMYAVASRLEPDTYMELATAVYAEMALAGVTCVGEFHYLHHDRDGHRYSDPNAMAEALREAAWRAGIRLTLLDTCYLSNGIGKPLDGVQKRFGDGDAGLWAERSALLRADPMFRVGSAVHSVRAVPADQLPVIAEAATGRPLHVHLSEQPAENAECLAAHGVTPTRLLDNHGVLSPRTTAVHATHLTPDDVVVLGTTGATACLCPTTERDLADGIGPARDLADAGSALALGTDQHAVIDMFEEARAMELNERLVTNERGRFTLTQLMVALTDAGHQALGWPEAGRIEPGAPADLVAVRLDTVRTVGCDPAQFVMCAAAADVHTVVVQGREVVSDGEHVLGDVAGRLSDNIAGLTRSAR